MSSQYPAYNLKAVIHETGLTAATLRAWERRYGLLKPQRSPGGHRMYTQHEINLLKWLVARQAEGLSISRAVEMWRSQESDAAGAIQTGPDFTPQVTLQTGESTLDQLRGRWLAACLAYDESTAEHSLAQALAIASPDVICVEVLQKGLAEIGERWYAGTASVQQEHFASALAVRRLNALMAAAPRPTRPGHVLTACPQGEAHDLALLMITFILRWRGWDVVYLGANVPVASLDDTLQSTAPLLVLSLSQTLPGTAALVELAGYVNSRGVPLAYGGGIFNQIPTLTGYIPGYFLGNELSAVPQTLEHLVTHWPAMPIPHPAPTIYGEMLEGFTAKEALILLSVNSTLQNGPIAPRYLAVANVHLTRAISAALTLGNIDLLDHSAGWLKGLLKNYGLSPALAGRYYAIYRQAIQEHLGSQADILLDWLAKAEAAVR